MPIKSYTGLIRLESFAERFKYLELHSAIGIETFGSHRFLNQEFYNSEEWKIARRKAITRDYGCDLGIRDREINGIIIVHHIIPITIFDIEHATSKLFDLDNLICVSSITHKAIHYGNDDILMLEPAERFENDTCPWRNRR